MTLHYIFISQISFPSMFSKVGNTAPCQDGLILFLGAVVVLGTIRARDQFVHLKKVISRG